MMRHFIPYQMSHKSFYPALAGLTPHNNYFTRGYATGFPIASHRGTPLLYCELRFALQDTNVLSLRLPAILFTRELNIVFFTTFIYRELLLKSGV